MNLVSDWTQRKGDYNSYAKPDFNTVGMLTDKAASFVLRNVLYNPFTKAVMLMISLKFKKKMCVLPQPPLPTPTCKHPKSLSGQVVW